MATFRYAVVWAGHEWRIVSNRRSIGHFRSSDTAMTIAESLAREAVEEGHDTELLMQEQFGQLFIVPLPEEGASEP